LPALHEYKRFENNLVLQVKALVVAGVKGVGAAAAACGRALTRR